jgi:hypothetical protein
VVKIRVSPRTKIFRRRIRPLEIWHDNMTELAIFNKGPPTTGARFLQWDPQDQDSREMVLLREFQELIWVSDAEIVQNEERLQQEFAEYRKTAPGPIATGDKVLRQGRFLMDRALELHSLRAFCRVEMPKCLEPLLGYAGPASIVCAYLAGEWAAPAYAAWIVAIIDGPSWQGSDGSLYRSSVKDEAIPAFPLISLAIDRRLRDPPAIQRLCLEVGLATPSRWAPNETPSPVARRVSRLLDELHIFHYFRQFPSQ